MDAATARRAPTGGDVLGWTLVGAALALVALGGLQLSGSWGLYLLLGLVALAWVPWCVRIAGGTERLLLLVFVFALQLQLGFHVVFWDGPKPAGNQGIYVSLVLVVAVALVGFWAVRRALGHARPFVVHRPLLGGAIAFLGAALVSFANTPWRMMSVFGVFEIGVLALVALVAAHWCATPAGLRTVFAALRFSLLFQSVVIITEHALGVPLSLTHGVSQFWVWGAERFAGTLGAPSAAGTFMAIGIVVVVGQAASSEEPDRSWLTRVTVAVALVALLLTQTRSAWVALLLGGGGLAWTLRRRRGPISGRRVLRYAGIGAVALAATWPVVGARLGENHTAAFWQRWYLIRITLEMVKAHPVAGVGINAATEQIWIYARGFPVPPGVAKWVFVAHNQFVLVAAETGLLGLAALIYLFKTALGAARQAMVGEDRALRDAGTVLFWALVMMCWALNVDMVTASMTYVLLWFLFGMAAGVAVQRPVSGERARAGLA